MNEAAMDGHPLRCTQDGAMPIVLAEELEADPHTVCARYRTLSPVVARSTGGFVVLGAAEIDALLKDDRLCSTKTEAIRAKGITDGPLWEFYNLSMQVGWSGAPEATRAFYANICLAIDRANTADDPRTGASAD